MEVTELKEKIWEKNKNYFNSINTDASNLILLKVNISIADKEPGTEINNTQGGVELSTFKKVGEYFRESEYFTDEKPETPNIHIIVKPVPAVNIVFPTYNSDEIINEIKNKVLCAFPHKLNVFSIIPLVEKLALIWHIEPIEIHSPVSNIDPYAKLKTEPSFFKISLPRGMTAKTHQTVDLCLPSYKSESGANYNNPFYDDPQFKETISLVKEKINEETGDVIVLTGVSGGGKTSVAFGIAMEYWSIYVDCSPSGGRYDNLLGISLESIRSIKPEFNETNKQYEVYKILDLVLLSRGLCLIKMFTQGKISNPKEWLLAQIQMNDAEIRGNLLKMPQELVVKLFIIINACLKIKRLILIFDEAQVFCRPEYGKYNGGSNPKVKLNLLQAYAEHLTNIPVTCILSGTYMNMANSIFPATSIAKTPGLCAHIMLKLPFLSCDDVIQNLNAAIDLNGVTSKTLECLGYFLRGRPQNCASFVQMLISKDRPKNENKNQTLLELLDLWYKKMSNETANYMRIAFKSTGLSNGPSLQVAIMDVLRFNVFYNNKYRSAIKLLQHSIIPSQSPEYITLHPSTSYKIIINPIFESYIVSSIEAFLKNETQETLVDIFVNSTIWRRFDNDISSSIGNEFDAVFITSIIQKCGFLVKEELNKWKNGQQFELPQWITPTMKFITTSNLSRGIPIADYVKNTTYYNYAIQPDIFSGSDVVLFLKDDQQNTILLSASCRISGSLISRNKVKRQLFKTCMKFQYMEKLEKKRKISAIKGSNKKLKQESNQMEIDASDLLHEVHEEDNLYEEQEFSWKKPEYIEIGISGENNLPYVKVHEVHEEYNLEEQEYDKEDNLEEGTNYDLNYTKTAEEYQISKVPEHAKNHEEIETSTKNMKHIYISVELPHRSGAKPELFRYNEYGDLVIIVDDRNMKQVFGSGIKKLVENLKERYEYQERKYRNVN